MQFIQSVNENASYLILVFYFSDQNFQKIKTIVKYVFFFSEIYRKDILFF